MNFSDILKKKASDIERPPILPPGTYTFQVAKVPTFETRTSAKGSWDVIDFILQPVEADEDVSPEALAEYGSFSPASQLRNTFMFDQNDAAAVDRTLFRMKQFIIEHLKVDASADATLSELLPQTMGLRCKAFVKNEARKDDPETMDARISRTAPV